MDKLDGRVQATFFDRHAATWRREQARLRAAIEYHRSATRTYCDEGVHLLELARRASRLFESQEPREKRRLLVFLLSNCSWKEGKLDATFRQPFDLLSVAATTASRSKSAEGGSEAVSKDWLLRLDSNQQPSG